MAASVTNLFTDSLGGRPGLWFAVIGCVGRPPPGLQPGTAAGANGGGARA